ncbi:MAG: peptidoglycan editing factor PgeF [Thiotrichales bacterium]
MKLTQNPNFLRPEWPIPRHVHAFVTTRTGGFSRAPYQGFNLATHVGDDPARVARNRDLLRLMLELPEEPVWLTQVHGTQVADVSLPPTGQVEADAAITDRSGVVCAVLTADCLPVFFSTLDGDKVALAHAGWRGLASGVLEATLAAFAAPPEEVMVWLGPAIGPNAFEVGQEVLEAFLQGGPDVIACFEPAHSGKWFADIYALARLRLMSVGCRQVFGGGLCTYTDSKRFYSYRRDGGATGRMASLIWMD